MDVSNIRRLHSVVATVNEDGSTAGVESEGDPSFVCVDHPGIAWAGWPEVEDHLVQAHAQGRAESNGGVPQDDTSVGESHAVELESSE